MIQPYTQAELEELSPHIARRIAEAEELYDDRTAKLYRRLLATARSGLDAERRLDALRCHLDCEGEARFTVFANEMVELDGMWNDEDESIPAMQMIEALSVTSPARMTWHLTLASRLSHALREWRLRRLHRLLVKLTPTSNYVSHCRRELAPWFAEGEDSPNRWMADGTERMLRLFATEGHSGSSAPFAVSVFKQLAMFKPWGPLTGAESEWGEPFDYDGTQQNRRCSNVFRGKDGRAYNSEGRVFRRPDGGCYTGKDSRVFIEFPYEPTVEYVDVPE